MVPRTGTLLLFVGRDFGFVGDVQVVGDVQISGYPREKGDP